LRFSVAIIARSAFFELRWAGRMSPRSSTNIRSYFHVRKAH
jgi:hypothetical protein